MGTIAARKARHIVEHVETVLAIELLCACQALDLRQPLEASAPIQSVQTEIRRHVSTLSKDRLLHEDIEAITELVRSGRLVRVLEQAGFEVQ